MADYIRVLVCGAAGQMGRFVTQAVRKAPDMKVVAAVDNREVGRDAGELAGGEVTGTPIVSDLECAIGRGEPDVMIDFTIPDVVRPNMIAALNKGVRLVVGTTGIGEVTLDEVQALVEQKRLGAVVCPNFSLGANLMMLAAELAAKHYPYAEIIELHHEKKKDAPSGTALLTAELIQEARAKAGFIPAKPPGPEVAARGQAASGVPVHSVRLPGYVANQEVMFSDTGEVLTIKHESTSRESFMPGVLMAVRYVMKNKGLTTSLRDILLSQG
jgi:4-hydroxy-tetrahydrodipicolinate reductase